MGSNRRKLGVMIPTRTHKPEGYPRIGAAILLSFGGTIIIMKIIDKTIGLRVKEIEEDVGLDISEHAERAYTK